MSKNSQISLSTIINSFPELMNLAHGDAEKLIEGIGSLEAPGKGKILFLATPKALKFGLGIPAAAVVVPRKSLAAAESQVQDGVTILVSDQVELAMAKTADRFYQRTPHRSGFFGVHSSAVIGAHCQIDRTAIICPGAVIGDSVKIGADVFVGANSVIEAGCEIGGHTTLHPLVVLGPRTVIGNQCEIGSHTVIGKEGYGYAHDALGHFHRIPHLGRVVIEDDVHIGANCSIDSARFGETVIGKGSKLDNKIHIAHNCEIGAYSLITAGFTVAGSTKIGSRFMCGGDTSVTGHIEICDNVNLGGRSVVTKSITTPGQYAGFPLTSLKENLKIRAAIKLLPELLKRFRAEISESD